MMWEENGFLLVFESVFFRPEDCSLFTGLKALTISPQELDEQSDLPKRQIRGTSTEEEET